MLGLGRPRLKARPSLLELITKKNIDELSPKFVRVQPPFAKEIEHLPPLPTSPTKTPDKLDLPSLSYPKAPKIINMPPVSFGKAPGALE